MAAISEEDGMSATCKQCGIDPCRAMVCVNGESHCDACVRKTYARVAELEDALQNLLDEQNGPPLIRHRKTWQAAYDKGCDLLEATR